MVSDVVWLLFTFGCLSFCAFLGTFFVSLNNIQNYSDIDQRIRTYSYQITRINAYNGKISVGIISLLESMEQTRYGYLSYREESSGDSVLVSKFGEDNYQCVGICYCTEYERRATSSGIISRSILYLATAITSMVAFSRAKEYFEGECASALSKVCPAYSIKSEVEKCESTHNDEDSITTDPQSFIDSDNEEFKKYFCEGFCLPKRYRNEYKRKFSEDFECESYVKSGEIALFMKGDEVVESQQMSDGVHKNVLKKFEVEHMQQFCKVETAGEYFYEDNESNLHRLNESPCRSSMENIICVQTYPKTEVAMEVQNMDMVIRLKQLNLIESITTFDAMLEVDRGDFNSDEDPYWDPYLRDSEMPRGHVGEISAPHMDGWVVDQFIDLLESKGNSIKILDVGSGSGYLISIFAHIVCPMGGKVIGMEIEEHWVEESIKNLQKDDQVREWIESGCIEILEGDGYQGYSSNTGESFDIIHVGAATDGFPETLINQLKNGGRLISPVQEGDGEQYVYVVEKDDEGVVSKKKAYDESVLFVKMKGNSDQDNK